MNKYYVYLHCKATTGEVFYVGKGCNNRAFDVSSRSLWWRRVVAKYGYKVEFFAKGITELKAFDMEVELIALFGRIDRGDGVLINKTDGGEGVSGRNVTQETKDKIAAMKTGDRHTTYDPTVYRWVRKSGKVVFYTSQEMAKKYGFGCGDAPALIAGKRRSAFGWFYDHYRPKRKCSLELHVRGRKHGMYNPTKYRWVNSSGETESLSKYDMCKKHGMRQQDLSCVLSGRQKSAKGWFFETIKKTRNNQHNRAYK